MSATAEVNGWTCDTCGETTYCVHVDDGVTPMFLACSAESLGGLLLRPLTEAGRQALVAVDA